MLWTEVRKWAKGLGYETIKDKDDGKYYWTKLDSDDPNVGGVATSVSKLAAAIFNHLTDNKWLDHQKQYKENLETKRISVSDYQ